MAIEIIPKPKEKSPLSLKIAFLFSLFLLIGILVLSFSINYFKNKIGKEINQVEKEISEIKGEKEIKLEEKLEKYSKKIRLFSHLINSHIFLSNIFKLLEENTHRYVFFNEFNFVARENKLVLKGETKNFQYLFHQIKRFEELKKEKLINHISLNKTSLEKGEQGEKVIFVLSLILNKKALLKK